MESINSIEKKLMVLPYTSWSDSLIQVRVSPKVWWELKPNGYGLYTASRFRNFKHKDYVPVRQRTVYPVNANSTIIHTVALLEYHYKEDLKYKRQFNLRVKGLWE